MAILWMLPIIFFLLVSFKVLPAIKEEGRSIIQAIIPFIYTAGTTIWAWYVSRKHYPKVKNKLSKPITLFFIPFVFIYAVLFEASFNYGRFVREAARNAMMEHMQYHIFNDTLIIVIMLLVVWLFFRKVAVGKWTLLFSFLVVLAFQPFFTTTLEGITLGERVVFGFIWVWLLHMNWFFTSLLIHPKTEIETRR